MPISQRRRVHAAQGAGSETSTHFPNETTKRPEDSGYSLPDGWPTEKLVDPDEDYIPGSTHFQNETRFSRKTNRVNAATAQKTLADFLEANDTEGGFDVDDEDPVPIAGNTDPDEDEWPEDDTAQANAAALAKAQRLRNRKRTAAIDADPLKPGQQPTTALPNDEDPDAGYLSIFPESNELESQFPTSLLDTTAVPPATTPSTAGISTAYSSVYSEDDEDGGELESTNPEDSEGEPLVTAGSDDFPVVDVDNADDNGDDVVFASIGSKVHAIKGNRIVATISKRSAQLAGCEDEYQSDEYQEATCAEMARYGLRAGLKKQGFVLATVNLGGNKTLDKRVTAKTEQITAAIRRSTAHEMASMSQCLALAAVGINRGRFQGVDNVLLASLIDELSEAGVRGAGRIARNVFAQHGVGYAKSLLAVAQKLSTLPETVRNGYVAAFDMTTEESGDALEENEVSADSEGEIDETEVSIPETVTAALGNPNITRRSSSYSDTGARGKTITARAIASGEIPLPFSMGL